MFEGVLSLILFTIEFGILIYAFLKARDYPYFWNVIPILILLQLYQLSEFLVCTTGSVEVFGRIAFVIITFLPPTGYHLATKLVGWKHKDYYLGYLLAVGFSTFFAIIPEAVQLRSCNPFFAVYDFKGSPEYGYYYNGMLLYAVIFLLLHIRSKPEDIRLRASKILLFGYISFMLPMYLIVIYDDAYIIAVTSVMCKFALMLAVSLSMMLNKN